MAVHAHVRTSQHIYAPTTPRGGMVPGEMLTLRVADKRFLNHYYWHEGTGRWMKIIGTASQTEYLVVRSSANGALIGDRIVWPVEGMFANRFAARPFPITRN